MTDTADKAHAKRIAAEAAVNEIEADMIVGLGTGTTAAFAIAALGQRIVEDGLRITAAATSLATERAARAVGIELVDFSVIGHVDLAIDGADEVDPQFRAIKGGGGALLREKIVAASATQMLCIVDTDKLVPRLARPLPIEVLPFARNAVSHMIETLGAEPRLRIGDDGAPSLSDQGNLLIDCHFGAIEDAETLAAALDSVPGLLGHGLFLSEIDVLIIGGPNGVDRRERPQKIG